MYLKDTRRELKRIGPGTPMGELLRRFWIPALLERERPRLAAARSGRAALGEDSRTPMRDGTHVTTAVTRRACRNVSDRSCAAASSGRTSGRKEFMPQPPDCRLDAPHATIRALRPSPRHDERAQLGASDRTMRSKPSNSVAKFVPPFYTSASAFGSTFAVGADRRHAHVRSGRSMRIAARECGTATTSPRERRTRPLPHALMAPPRARSTRAGTHRPA